MKKIEIKVAGGTITLENNRISTERLRETGESEYNAAIDGIESLLLALYCAGVNLTDPKIIQAIEITLEALANNL